MRLAPDVSSDEFRSAVSKLAACLKPVPLGELRIRRIGTFLALLCDEAHHGPVSKIAWECVKQLDHLRAELTDEEITKRGDLEPELAANLKQWGYPYVGEAFRFHMTLTSSLDENQINTAQNMLHDFDTGGPVTLDSICIFGDPGGLKPFELVQRFDLID
jgi:hypothetical protein